MPQKRRRRRRRSPPGGSSRRRRGEDGASLSGSLVESDTSCISSSSTDDGCAPWPRYQSLLASSLSLLQLPPSADGDDPGSVDPRDLTAGEILQALTRRSFLDSQMLDALAEYQVEKCSHRPTATDDKDSGEFHLTHGRDSGEFHPADVAMVSVDSGDDIPHEDFFKD